MRSAKQCPPFRNLLAPRCNVRPPGFVSSTIAVRIETTESQKTTVGRAFGCWLLRL